MAELDGVGCGPGVVGRVWWAGFGGPGLVVRAALRTEKGNLFCGSGTRAEGQPLLRLVGATNMCGLSVNFDGLLMNRKPLCTHWSYL